MTKHELVEWLRKVYDDEDAFIDNLRNRGLLKTDDKIDYLKRLTLVHTLAIGRLVQMVPDDAESKE